MKRKKSLSRLIMVFVLVFSLGLSPCVSLMTGVSAYASVKTVKVKGKYYQSDARKMRKKINKFRTGKNAWYYKEEGSNKKVRLSGLKKLSYDYELEKIAMKRAAEIYISFSHTRPNGESCFSLYGEDYTALGENIAAGFTTVSSVFKAWQETNESYDGQGHRRNMLSEDFTCVGIACFEVDGQKYWVQEFGSPNSKAEKTKAVNGKKTVKVKVAS